MKESVTVYVFDRVQGVCARAGMQWCTGVRVCCAEHGVEKLN
jgi:hypothetical protein